MPQKCFMCGAAISQGILCDKCDKPRKPKASAAPPAEAVEIPAAPPAAPPAPRPTPKPPSPPVTVTQPRSDETTAVALDAFPKAPVLPFPVESASPALTSVVSLLIAAAVPSVL